MSTRSLHITCIGGPTAVLEWGGLRLLTDPTFDPAGEAHPTAAYTLRKTQGPAIALGGLPCGDPPDKSLIREG